MKLSNEKIERLRILKGKNNIKLSTLSSLIGISRYTTSSIINGRTDGFNQNTIDKINIYIQSNEVSK